MTSALMTLGTRAMFAAFAQLQVTGQNIANAGVDGYSRQSAELATAKGQFTGAGFFGKGVDVATVKRAHDAFLTREAAAATSLAQMDKARLDQLERLEAVFPTGERGIGYAAGQFLNAMVDLASNPRDISTREVVLARAQEVAARFAQAGRQVETLQAGVTLDLKNAVAAVNELAKNIAEVNQQIAQLKGLGHAPNDLLDQRDRLVNQLSAYIAVSTIPADDGTLGVFVAGGQRLVLSNQAQPLTVTADLLDPSRSAIGMVEAGGVLPLTADLLTGGSIAGLLRFQNDDLVAARNALGQMAAAFAAGVDEVHAAGLDLDGLAGGAMFRVGDAVVLPASTNGGAATVALTRLAGAGSQLEAEEYLLRFDGSAWRLTLADGATPAGGPYGFTGAQLAAGVDLAELGIRVQSAGAPAVGDRFLLQPVGRAAAEMRRVLDDPRGVAAATPAAVNGNALALAALRDAAFVGGATVTDAYAAAMANVGVRVQSARTAADISAAVRVEAERQRESKAGVNLDEEAARLIQFQQSYQAAAKVLQVAQQVFDTLLSTAAR